MTRANRLFLAEQGLATRLRGLAVFAPYVAGGGRLGEYERWLGRPVRGVVDNADETRGWEEMVRSATFLARSYAGKAAHPIIGIPMLVAGERGSLARGAAGDYDPWMHRVAQALVQNGLGDCTLRLGWEFNGNWMPWFAGDDPRAFQRYWRRSVDLFRHHSAKFSFDWCPTLGHKDMVTEAAWPGADFVDVIGADVYNEWWNPRSRDDLDARWHDEYLWARFGLQWHMGFARDTGKKISFPEWGTRPAAAHGGHGGGDDPHFIMRMAAWFDAAEDMLAYHGYFERIDVALAGGAYPQSAATFRRLFGA
ncbi:glycosyl hydrolase [Roseomonas sp. 18066]|uniref:glycosyl hydrolase n=1 Tax=Roseomonas sp. 18066 TaxID=2681412 RepID=UPI00135CD489|nr:glycosyl hydrolase [Roseomonas sp. 18066]